LGLINATTHLFEKGPEKNLYGPKKQRSLFVGARKTGTGQGGRNTGFQWGNRWGGGWGGDRNPLKSARGHKKGVVEKGPQVCQKKKLGGRVSIGHVPSKKGGEGGDQ